MESIPSRWKKTLKGYNTEDNILSEEESQCGIEANGNFIPLSSGHCRISVLITCQPKVFTDFKKILIK